MACGNKKFAETDRGGRMAGATYRALGQVHQTIARSYARWLLEVSYVQMTDLGQPENAVKPHPIYHDDVLEPLPVQAGRSP